MKRSIVVSSLILYLAVGLSAEASDTGTLTGKIELTKGRKGENSIVYLKGVKGQFVPPDQVAKMDQKGKTFVPHLLPVQKGQEVIFKDSDAFSHNVHIYWGRRSLFNQVQGPGQASEWLPRRTGEYLVLCDLHREMSAFVLVFEHPFFAVVDHQVSEEFTLENIPAGTYTLVVVREERGDLKEYEQEITVEANEVNTVITEL